jgi:hypothetical protein
VRVRIYFTLFFILIGGCDHNNGTTVQQTQAVPTCTPYFVTDFNNIVRLDRMKNGYSSEMTGLCAGFQVRYKAVGKCGAYQERSGALEVVNTSTIDYICGRNEKIGAALNAQPTLLSTAPKNQGQIAFSDSGEVTMKVMILDVAPFTEARNSTKDFANRKVFVNGKLMGLTDVKKSSYCLFSSSAPIEKDDMLQITTIEDATKDKVRTLNFSAEAYRPNVTASISCVGVGTKEKSKEILKKHFGNVIAVD